MTGQVPDAGPYIERMDILVNASDPEPFGIVLLEGMAHGVAVVAVDSGGPAEFVENGRTGVLARSGEPEALADALEPLLASPALRQTLGAAGRERFTEEFTDAAMRERFFAQLRIAGRGPPQTGAASASAHTMMPLGPVTIVAHDIGPVGGMERQLAELALGLRRAGHEVHGDRAHLRAAAGRGRRLSPRARAQPPVPPRLSVVRAGGLAAGVAPPPGRGAGDRRDRAQPRGRDRRALLPPGPPREPQPAAAAAALVRARGRGSSSACASGCASAPTARRRSCASPRASPRRCASTSPPLAERVVAIHNGVDTDAFAPGTRASEARALRERLRSAAAPERAGGARSSAASGTTRACAP